MPERLFQDRDALAALCLRHAIRRLSLFGSVLRGTARPDSDVDLLVEFVPGSEPGCSASQQSRQSCPRFWVDLRTPADLSRHFRTEVMSTAETQYAACTSLAW